MTTYDFTFVVDADPYADGFGDRLIESGCDGATFILMRGSAAISFDREADTYKDAVFSALKQIKSTGSEVLRFEPDFLVNASDIATRSGLTRSSIGHFINGHRRDGFPAPHSRLSSNSPLWDWVSVSEWLVAQGKLPKEVHHEAMISRIINAGSQINQIDPNAHFDVEAALQAA